MFNKMFKMEKILIIILLLTSFSTGQSENYDYTWDFVKTPKFSKLSNFNFYNIKEANEASFTPDKVGNYKISLKISQGNKSVKKYFEYRIDTNEIFKRITIKTDLDEILNDLNTSVDTDEFLKNFTGEPLESRDLTNTDNNLKNNTSKKILSGKDLDNSKGTSLLPIISEAIPKIREIEESKLEIVRMEFDIISKSKSTYRTLLSDWSYAIIAFGDYRVKDIDVKISKEVDGKWIEVKKDDSAKNKALVIIDPTFSGLYQIEITVYEYNDGYSTAHYGLIICHE